MANAVVNTAKNRFLKGDFDLLNDTLKLMLITSSHTPDIDAEEFIDDVSANEVSASGTYIAGGATLSSKVIVTDDTNDRAYLDAADIAFTSATIVARYAYLYKDTGTASTSPIIGYFDYTENKTSAGGTFTHSFTAPASGGVLYLT